ncbi:hypothetical protein JCM6292_3871 [Bacteroides pyogenes JCM 6292]|uniref:Uncharacterized protein n=1 Tax=Bacteroides pyogenes JCM 6292 TaxID=1235809 RepID=W4PBV5_9BACE|nr:hypothetical protein JCM6292_3871 [Bacteroides pyogenes JCM 6292]
MAEHVLRELFSATDKPAEVYYRSAQGILLSPVKQSLSFFFLHARYLFSTENVTIRSSAIW